MLVIGMLIIPGRWLPRQVGQAHRPEHVVVALGQQEDLGAASSLGLGQVPCPVQADFWGKEAVPPQRPGPVGGGCWVIV